MSVRQGNVIIAGGNSVTVDQALDINSPNAIANSAVTAGLNGKEPTITLTASRAVITDANGKVAASTVTSTELGYVSGVTSAIQTQLNGKEPTITLTASRAVISDANGKIDVSSTTSTELGYVHGVTSDIQTQINAKADDNAVVHLASAETISGVKTFSASPKVPTAGITSDDTTAASTAFVRDIMPAGVIVPFAGTTVPAGYLLCDGSAVSRTTYADLFAAIGTTYGAGDGNTTFNLPNISDYAVPIGTDGSKHGNVTFGAIPNIEGSIYSGDWNIGINLGTTGAFVDDRKQVNRQNSAGQGTECYRIRFNANLWSALYGALGGNKVVPKGTCMYYVIKY